MNSVFISSCSVKGSSRVQKMKKRLQNIVTIKGGHEKLQQKIKELFYMCLSRTLEKNLKLTIFFPRVLVP